MGGQFAADRQRLVDHLENRLPGIRDAGAVRGVQIAYRNLMYYLTPEANYEDARNGAIQSAIDLYEQDSQAHRSVVDAWYAVGVGKSYAEETGWTDSYSPAQQATKIMRNGQLFIIRNGQTYHINGMEVR